MPETINIRGDTLLNLRRKLLAVKNVATRRNLSGWTAFQSDEVWGYESEKDDRVCPVCASFDYMNTMSGDYVKSEFTQKSWENKPRELHPQTHDDHTHNGESLIPRTGEPKRCGCRLFWLNYPHVLTKRLADEMTAEAQ